MALRWVWLFIGGLVLTGCGASAPEDLSPTEYRARAEAFGEQLGARSAESLLRNYQGDAGDLLQSALIRRQGKKQCAERTGRFARLELKIDPEAMTASDKGRYTRACERGFAEGYRRYLAERG